MATGWAARRWEIESLVQEELSREYQAYPARKGAEAEALLGSTVVGVLQRKQRSVPDERVAALRQHLLKASDFDVVKTLSSSVSSRVELVRSRQLAADPSKASLLVLKRVEKQWAQRMRKQQFHRHELDILRLARKSRKKFIPRLVAAFLSDSEFHVLIEAAGGGDLDSLLASRSLEGGDAGFPEHWVQVWAAEVIEAIDWLHGQGWAHRDIKPSNLLLSSAGRVLLTDFGSAAPLSPTGRISKQYCMALVGTPDYISPEALLFAEAVAESSIASLEGNGVSNESGDAYGKEVDMWSLGATIYELLYGATPFFAEAIAETYDRILAHADTLAFPSSSDVSIDARQALRSLLTTAGERTSLAELKEARWFQQTPWNELEAAPSPFVPPPANLADSSGLQQTSNMSAGFDFSAFFSSPGLSVLRTSRSSTSAQAQAVEDIAFWQGMTWLPPADEFDSLPAAPPLPSPAAALRRQPKLADSIYFTPARSSALRQSPHLGSEGGSSTGSSRKGVTPIEAWREMQEKAWEVGTARKIRREREAFGREPEPDTVDRLSARQKDLLSDIDALALRYDVLFKLAASEVEGEGDEQGRGAERRG